MSLFTWFSSSATTHTFCLSRLSHFHLSPLRGHVLRITPFPGRMGVPPSRAGWRPHTRCVCVTLGIIGILLDFSGLPFCFISQQGVAAGTRVCHQRRHSRFPGDTGTDHPSVPAIFLFSEWHEAKPRTSQVATFGSHARTLSCRLDRRFRS